MKGGELISNALPLLQYDTLCGLVDHVYIFSVEIVAVDFICVIYFDKKKVFKLFTSLECKCNML